MRPPESWATARVTLALTLVTGGIWILLALLRLNDWAIVWAGFVPARVDAGVDTSGAPVWLTPLTATLVHAGNPIHVIFNLIILVFCGRPTEAVVGPVGFGILYVVGAYAAAAVHYLLFPASVLPMVGASGAISAVLGAYAILFGRNKVKVAHPTVALWLNALWLMVAWVVLNVIVGFAAASMAIGVAFGAHIGGFLVGVLLANPLLLLRYRRA
ncbi:rhomboid family intramembrane serine protease [Sphingosinicella sp. CPCC 101087]|uniref:rhomboid family intramembrane serine protease n=1 Tax=Sphingosinicella sp. CPCC 101087 TaxID=2497754 RepID=UPI00101CCD9D|nr:rhomboid family intramembrane serine protease [Sphingosinicella sp. CPCC 101087]